MDLYLHLFEIPLSKSCSAVASPCHTGLPAKPAQAFTVDAPGLPEQEVSPWSDGLMFLKACSVLAGRQAFSPDARVPACRTVPRPL